MKDNLETIFPRNLRCMKLELANLKLEEQGEKPLTMVLSKLQAEIKVHLERILPQWGIDPSIPDTHKGRCHHVINMQYPDYIPGYYIDGHRVLDWEMVNGSLVIRTYEKPAT